MLSAWGRAGFGKCANQDRLCYATVTSSPKSQCLQKAEVSVSLMPCPRSGGLVVGVASVPRCTHSGRQAEVSSTIQNIVVAQS